MPADTAVKTIDRAAAVLKLLAEQPLEGWRLSDVARRLDLGKTTAHRLLNALVAVGFVEQSPDTRRYHLGFELTRLGMAARRFDIVELARPALLRLARDSGDTVFLSVPEGLEAVCVDRAVGEFPIKTLTLDVGDRRPLGVGAGSLALLAFRPADEIDEVIAAVAPKLPAFGTLDVPPVRGMVAAAREQGYAFNDGRIIRGMCALAVPVRDGQGRVVAALSIAAIEERMRPDRVATLAQALAREAEALSKRLTDGASPSPR